MSDPEIGQLIRHFSSALEGEVTAFIIDRQARGLSQRTIEYYSEELQHWLNWAAGYEIRGLSEITPTLLRQWLLHLGKSRNPGGVHANYRAVRAFLRWTWEENEIAAPNPMMKVRPPRVAEEPLEPVPLSDLKAMLDTCDRKSFVGLRDRALLLSLLDTGCRANEFLSLKVSDVDIATGSVLVREGKGGKARTAFLGSKARQSVIRYLKLRGQVADDDRLWVTVKGHALAYGGLRRIMTRRAGKAGVPEPSLHAFRRAFALWSLRNGADIYSLQRLMGHSDLTVLRRYLKQTDSDLQETHRKTGPVDNML